MPRIVLMAEIAVSPIVTGDEVLETSGISTCICIALQGTYSDNPFLLMHHWAGIDPIIAAHSDKSIIEMLIDEYFFKIEEQLGDKDTEEMINPIIDKITIIGGQKKEFDSAGNTVLIGTEREVAALRDYFIEALRSSKSLSPVAQIHMNPFNTVDEESITVRMDAAGLITWYFDTYPTFSPS